ncbi:YjzD family protein [Ligilactobacillus sp. Marseille-Q7487]|jgi:hypothetical protein|uniref:YjzD family protein n=1 Tax=Ligilactobacillus sp. Marseille-Q7487 TaxID=3022128 RepID=UPI0015B78720|nr:YjzD family protein [Ligilactobacillus sp. Marseille-Q7487]
MAKQLTILFWGFIYGTVLGYIVSSLGALEFNPIESGVIAMIGGFIIINILGTMIKAPKKTN